MDNYYICRISNNEKINLKDCNIDELYRLHYEEEKYAAKILKEMSPFSEERYDFLNKSYDVIEKIKEYRNTLENKEPPSKQIFYDLFIKTKKRIKKKEPLIVLELGCNNCTFIKSISNMKDLMIYGCDLHPTYDCNSDNVVIYKETILDALKKFEDNSIDILVADNVCEHFFQDEADVIYELISNKLSKSGKILFWIPNRYIGPKDISRMYNKIGSKAECFHFMEQSYKENIQMFKMHNLVTDYLCLRISKNKSIIYHNFLNIDKLKVSIEKFLSHLFLKKYLFSILGYNIYILKKS